MKTLPLTLIIVSTTSLTSCATLELVTFGITGISYVATGKSLTDHAISTVMSQDCALYRVIIGQKACIEEALSPNSVLIAQAKPIIQTEAKSETAALVRIPQRFAEDENKPVKVSNAVLSNNRATQSHSKLIYTDSNATSVLANNLRGQSSRNHQTDDPSEIVSDVTWLDRIVSAQATPKLFAVLGSFSQLQFANERMEIHSQYNPKLVTVNKSDHTVQYRVVIGPLNEQSYQAYIEQTGQSDAWRLMLCQDNYELPPCNPPMLVKNDPL
ncbi:hypothetical protein ORJ66_10310 [Pseudoalteromonas tunicata]|uniref:hypothetical protein n=1 Tax=Pseudoalteromonas tunicata TaxID=314281 RepID=UPI00273EA210|nr:hypothetical protein [Pseudoalteromonas tunicata]MDP5213433.1 hypothetical protein [Pseudoalteromonas tunicata]